MDIIRNKAGEITGIKISGTIFIQGYGANDEKAEELNNYSNKTVKSKEINGINVSVNITYKYDNKKNKKDLKAGENILTFSSENGRSHVVSRKKEINGTTQRFTGNTGTIFKNSNENRAVLHESLHLLGLSDRYDDYRESNLGPAYSTPNIGFEKDIMGGGTNVNSFHYDQWMKHAIFRSKHNSNTNRVLGYTAADVNANGRKRSPYERGGTHKPDINAENTY